MLIQKIWYKYAWKQNQFYRIGPTRDELVASKELTWPDSNIYILYSQETVLPNLNLVSKGDYLL